MQNTEIETSLPRIQLLEEHLIDQIKAGEVLESPANMAKELIENSLDAGATKITLKIKNDPLEFFSISDNGHGIHPEDLPLVFARHATSKIHDYNDIYHLSSYGFRGEALASLGSVAKVQIKSKTQNNPSHSMLHQYGKSEKIHTHGDTSKQAGTEIIVTDLFAATPARLKFIQNKLTELQKLRKIIHAYIIAYPEITWDVHEDHDFMRYPSNDTNLREVNLLSPNLTKKELEYKNIKVTLWIDEHPSKKRNTLNQFVYVNKRLINFGVAHSIIVKNLNSSPSYALFIDTIQSNLDINVHPAKTEVKFLDKASVLALISTIIKTLAPAPAPQAHPANTNFNAPINNSQHQFQQDSNQGYQTCFEHFYLLTEDGVIAQGVRLDKLLQALLEKNTQDKDQEGVPLLISKPFHFPILKSQQVILEYWRALGLGFQVIDNNTLLLSSLPAGWLFTQYENLLKYILDTRITTKITIAKDQAKNLIAESSLKSLIELLDVKFLEKKFILQALDKLSIHD